MTPRSKAACIAASILALSASSLGTEAGHARGRDREEEAGDLREPPARPPCLTVADCPGGAEGHATCVAFTCRTGSSRADVEVIQTVAVALAFVDAGRPEVIQSSRYLTALLRDDLARSGFYAVLPESRHPAGFERDGVSDSELRRHAWLAAGASRLIRLAVIDDPASAPRLHVTIRDLERWGPPSATESFVLKLPLARQRDLRTLSASFVNGLIGRDTGLPGALGQRILGTSLVTPGVKEIVTVGDDGRDWRQLTRNGSLNLNPAWGPGGTAGWMSYVTGNTDWWLGEAPLSSRPGLNASGAWSPDGRWLVLALSDRGDAQLVLLDGATGAEHARLTDVSSLSTSPTWSPDGRAIAFVSDLQGGLPQLFTLDIETGRLTQLTREGYNGSPDWSPLGDALVFQRQFGAVFAIMRLDLTTGEVRRLSQTRGSAENPTFSPDGRRVAFHVADKGSARLWVMDADGDGAAPLGGEVTSRSFLSPAWEPLAEPAPWPPRDLD